VLCLSVNAEFQEELAGYIATAHSLEFIFCKKLRVKEPRHRRRIVLSS
jgi:hypothetical protein